jgi:hypothetical protein
MNWNLVMSILWICGSLFFMSGSVLSLLLSMGVIK